MTRSGMTWDDKRYLILASLEGGVKLRAKDMAEATGLTLSVVHHTTRTLCDQGEIKVERGDDSGQYHYLYSINEEAEMALSKRRFENIWSGLSEAARKVYEGVPMQTAWSFRDIHMELARVGATCHSIEHTQGCVASLVRAGLVVEQPRGMFRRTRVKTEATPTDAPQIEYADTTVKAENMHKTDTTKKNNPLEILGGFASRLTSLAEEARKLSAEIETAAVEIDEMIRTGGEEVQKLRQLKDLLKNLA